MNGWPRPAALAAEKSGRRRRIQQLMFASDQSRITAMEETRVALFPGFRRSVHEQHEYAKLDAPSAPRCTSAKAEGFGATLPLDMHHNAPPFLSHESNLGP